jgi:hypothetical protein
MNDLTQKRGLLGYLKEATSLPGEGAAVFATEWKKLTEEDKVTLVQWAHEQGDTNVVLRLQA